MAGLRGGISFWGEVVDPRCLGLKRGSRPVSVDLAMAWQKPPAWRRPASPIDGSFGVAPPILLALRSLNRLLPVQHPFDSILAAPGFTGGPGGEGDQQGNQGRQRHSDRKSTQWDEEQRAFPCRELEREQCQEGPDRLALALPVLDEGRAWPGHVFRVVDGIALEPRGFDQPGVGVLADGGDRRLLQYGLGLVEQAARSAGSWLAPPWSAGCRNGVRETAILPLWPDPQRPRKADGSLHRPPREERITSNWPLWRLSR